MTRLILLFIGALTLSLNAADMDPIRPVRLRCEYRDSPMGIDVRQPRLGWILADSNRERRSARQTAYQILVASSSAKLVENAGDLWDSRKTVSDLMGQIEYRGKALRDYQQVFWKVRVWDESGRESAWSDIGTWTMGLLEADSWKAKWLTSPAMQGVMATIGFRSSSEKGKDMVKSVQIDLGRSTSIDGVVLVPINREGKNGYGFPVRFKIDVDDHPFFPRPQLIADFTTVNFDNPGNQPTIFSVKKIRGRYIRLTTTAHSKQGDAYFMALRQLAVMSKGQNVALYAPVETEDSVEDWGWGRMGLTDGVMVSTPSDVGYNSKFPASLLMRREFRVKSNLKRALVTISGLGQYELQLNARKVGRDLLTPGWTNYQRTVLYDTYDVTEELKSGENVAGIVLGGGIYRITAEGGRYTRNYRMSYGPLKAIAQFHLEYADGTTETIATDESWRVHSGSITFSNIFGGEDEDARLEIANWNRPGFDAQEWLAAVLTPGPGGQLRGLSCSAEPVRAFERLKPVARWQVRPGTVVYDFGQNTSIMPYIRVKGMAGSKVRIVPSELVNDAGAIDDTMCQEKSYWTYTLAGKNGEEWFPKFFYRGARYLQVECSVAENGKDLPVVESLEAVVVHGNSPEAGEFSCSNELFNRIYQLVRWAQVSNIVSLLTDCPQREKFGWVEQNHLNGPSLRYNFALQPLFEKGMNDMANSQTARGLIPNIAPEFAMFGASKYGGGFRSSPEWGSAFIIVPWQQYLYDGDRKLLRKYYKSMGAYWGYLDSRAQAGIVDFGLGDWYDLGPNPPGYTQLTSAAFTATAFYYYDTWILSEVAKLLNESGDAQKYRSKAEKIRQAFNRKFFNPESKQYALGSQCANAMALAMNLAEAEDRGKVLQNLVADIRKNGLTTGDVGYRYLIRALANAGRSDVLYELNNQSDKPGYGYNLKMGATAMTESWDARRTVSQNHFMLGQIMEWFYHDLAGIQPDREGVGFRKIIIKPAVLKELSWGRAAYDSASGKIVSEWKWQPGQLELNIEIPPNTTATVFIPTRLAKSIREGELPAGAAPGVRFLRNEPGQSVFQIASGSYRFVSEF